ncbi:MAG: serine hydrolase domain-containing protein, partial [Pirellulales bacterium]
MKRRHPSLLLKLLLSTMVAAGVAVPPVGSAGTRADPAPAKADSSYAAVARLAAEARERFGSPAMSVALVVDDRLVWSEGFGLADVENRVPARPDTVYRIASISKPISATAVMQLVQRGRVDLDDPIQNFV